MNGSKKTHPFVPHTQCGSIGDVLHIFNVAQLLVNPDTIFVIANELGLGIHIIADLESYTDLPGVLDAETQFKGNFNVVAIHLEALESVHRLAVLTVLHTYQTIVRIRIHNPGVGEIIMSSIT